MNQENKNVFQLPHTDIEKIAHATSGIKPLEIPDTTSERSEPKPKSYNLAKRIAAGALAATGVLWLAGPRGEQEPVQREKTLLEHAQEAAHIPVSIEDESVITTVKVKTKSSENRTPAAAVSNNKEISEYVIDNPDEAATIQTSANSLPSLTSEVALIEKDLDSDGDLDTFVAPVEKG